MNGGRDIYNAAESGGEGGVTIDPGTIAITQDPVNVTVNQGQTASFTVAATVTNGQQLNYQWQKKEYGTQLLGVTSSALTKQPTIPTMPLRQTMVMNTELQLLLQVLHLSTHCLLSSRSRLVLR